MSWLWNNSICRISPFTALVRIIPQSIQVALSRLLLRRCLSPSAFYKSESSAHTLGHHVSWPVHRPSLSLFQIFRSSCASKSDRGYSEFIPLSCLSFSTGPNKAN
ncbi:hypothetical protein WG66_009498 [Moniliophthora roreri]|nr:hypothetical protein WG66_009498 [Moniliophthora roreri]